MAALSLSAAAPLAVAVWPAGAVAWAVEAPVAAAGAAPPPNRDDAALGAEASAEEVAAGVDAVVVGAPPKRLGFAEAAPAAGVLPPPKRPEAGWPAAGFSAAGLSAAGLAPNSELAVEAGAAAGVAAGVAPAPPNKPLAAGAAGAAGLAPPNSPEEAGAAAPAAAGCAVDPAAVVAGLAPPKRLEALEVPEAAGKSPPEAGFDESAGGAPAGVVEGRENIGFAGVAAVADVEGAAAWVDGAAAALLPKRPPPEG
jgi:hypothetical protein